MNIEDFEEDEEEITGPKLWMAKILMDLGVVEVSASLSGSGDSGDIDEVNFFGKDGVEFEYENCAKLLQDMTLDDGRTGSSSFYEILLHQIIERDASDLGNYYDNEGGSVYLKYAMTERGMVQEIGEFAYNEDYDNDGDDDDYDEDADGESYEGAIDDEPEM